MGVKAERARPASQPNQADRRLAQATRAWLRKHEYVGVVRRAVGQARRHHITSLAAALAYYAFLVIPASLLVAVGVFALFASPETVSDLVDRLGTVMPKEATDLVSQSLARATEEHRTGIALIGIGGLLALWAIGSAMQNVMWALNTVYGRDETRGWVRRRLAAWGMALLALVGLTLALGLLVLGSHVSDWVGSSLDQEQLVTVIWWVGQWPVLLLGMFVAFAGILYLGPNIEHPSWRFLTFGAVFAVVVWLLASGAFSLYVSQFGSYNKAWGALTAVVIMLTWLWLSAVALLVGAEIDAEAERSRELRREETAESALVASPKA